MEIGKGGGVGGVDAGTVTFVRMWVNNCRELI